jgi:hypothetical protein
MSKTIAALLLTLLLATTTHAQSSAFRYQPERAPAPGTVWHYTKSNIDGSAPWHLDLYVASPTRIDVVKWAEGAADFVEVSADIDVNRVMPVNLQQWNTTASAREPRLWGTTRADKLVVTLAGGPTFELETAGQPLHLWGFDLMGLAFVLPHLVDPDAAFEIGVVDPNRPGTEDRPFAQGIARFEPAGTEAINGVAARKYRISGSVFGAANGWLWADQASGRLLRVEHPLPTSSDWSDWKLDAIGVEQLDGIRWEQFKLGLAQQIRGKATTALLARNMFGVYEKQGIDELLASIPDWRTENLKLLENELNKVGYALLNAEKPADAVRVFRRITEDFPDSANAWDSLAEGQIAAGDKAGARKSYQRVLQLLPDDEHAKAQLEAL